jgi:hypothetical protein
MSGWERWQFAFGMMMASQIFVRMPAEIITGQRMPMNQQWLLGAIALFFSLWWIPRERGLPKRPSNYDLGYQDGLAAAQNSTETNQA